MFSGALASLLLLISSCSATFENIFSSASATAPEAYNVCVYSRDVSQYPPTCFKCPVDVYSMALTACLNATDLPKNITYSGAKCLEGNCNINYPAASTSKPVTVEAATGLNNPLTSIVQQLLSLFARSKRSVDANSVDDSSMADESSEWSRTLKYSGEYRIVGNKSTVASELGFDLDYLT